jgi:hypothetical protein
MELRLELIFCIPGSKVEWIEGPAEEVEGDGDGVAIQCDEARDAAS